MTDRTERLKQELNRELGREGKLQRAGMRKCRILTQRAKFFSKSELWREADLSESEKLCILELWPVNQDYCFLETIAVFYYHGPSGDLYTLETEGGVLFRTDSKIRFVT